MALLGMFKRKESLVLTFHGWILLSIIVICLFYLAFNNIYSFLSVSKIAKAEILVVEGCLPEYSLKEVIKEFGSGDYRILVTIGEEIEYGPQTSKYKNYSELAASILKRNGINEDAIIAVVAKNEFKDKLYASAISLKRWLQQSDLSVKTVNVCSLGPSARKSRLILQRTLGEYIRVGVISYESHHYGPDNWWKSSLGLKIVLGEMIEYFYTLFFYHPQK